LLQGGVVTPLAEEVKMEIDQEQQPAWITLRADSHEAVVSLAKIMQYPNSYLATLAQLQLQEGSDAAVRLDCDADEAKEIVAVLRQVGSGKQLALLDYLKAANLLLWIAAGGLPS
jgi:hypothetical protein